MNDKELYEIKLLAQLGAWSVEIAHLKAKTDLADADKRAAAEDKITELRARKQLVRDKLEAIRAHSDDAWEPLKADAAAAVKSLKHALRSIRTSI